MWHWNSLWARAPGDPPTIDDPALWSTPWTTEQALAVQTRSWEAMLSTSHSWWSMLLSTWPMVPTWPLPPGATAPTDPSASTANEPLAAKPATPRKTAPHKLPAATRRRTTMQARKN